MFRACAGLCALATLWVHGARGATVQYLFGNPGDETTVELSPAFNPTVVGSNLSGTPVTDPNNTVGIEISSAATTPAAAPFLRLDPQGNSADAAAAVANDKYYTFTLTADPGQLLASTSLEFDVARGGAGTPRGYVVRSSADNFATNLAQADVGTVRPTYTHVTIPLAAATFQNLQSLTFRVYSYSPAAGSSLDYDNIIYTAAIVPEPGSLALWFAASPLFLGRIRRGSRR